MPSSELPLATLKLSLLPEFTQYSQGFLVYHRLTLPALLPPDFPNTSVPLLGGFSAPKSASSRAPPLGLLWPSPSRSSSVL